MITFPLHPMAGQAVVVAKRVFRKRGQSFVTFDAPPGHVRTLPLEWTNQQPRARTPVVGGRAVLVDVGHLLTVVRWVGEQTKSLTGIGGRSASPQRERETSRQRSAADRTLVGRRGPDARDRIGLDRRDADRGGARWIAEMALRAVRAEGAGGYDDDRT